jgi:hypothetical protein
MLKTLASTCLVLLAFEAGYSQGWHGIQPLHSSCDEAKIALGIAECENKTYELNDATVSMTFSDGTCNSGWKVAAGTVLRFDVRPKPTMRLEDLRLDKRDYSRVADRQDPNIVYYKNAHEGLTIVAMADGSVAYLSYEPSMKDDILRCPQGSVDEETMGDGELGFLKFDEYGALTQKEEQKRLEAFALQLKAQPTVQGYIIAYGGRRSWPGEARDRGTCAKDYLIERQGIDDSRLVTIDGGYQEQAVVELYTKLENSNGRPFVSPTVDPRNVVIIKGNRTKDQLGVCRLQKRGSRE